MTDSPDLGTWLYRALATSGTATRCEPRASGGAGEPSLPCKGTPTNTGAGERTLSNPDLQANLQRCTYQPNQTYQLWSWKGGKSKLPTCGDQNLEAAQQSALQCPGQGQ